MKRRFTTAYSIGTAVLFATLSTAALRGQVGPANGAAQPPAQNSTANNPYHGYAADYPAPEVQAVPLAYARAVTAQAEQDQLLTDLHSTVDRIREDFNYSPEMLAATQEQSEALDAYDSARQRVLEKLSQDPTYRALISLVVNLKQKLEEQRPGAKPTDADLERVLATATLKLSYASSASAMEVAALSADDEVMQTHARLIDAANKVATLRGDFERQIRRNPEFVAARRSLDEARIARLTADAFLDGAIDARAVALDYAYYLHRFDQNTVGDLYTPVTYNISQYPYGFGYGYGYGHSYR
jgi:hypothetical protein